MKKAIKAALLSAFVFPGLGHLLLKRYISAAILATTAFTASYLLISKILEDAMQIVDKIQHGDLPADVITITELVSQQTDGNDLLSSNIMTSVLLITWLVAIIDCYRIGRSQENKR